MIQPDSLESQCSSIRRYSDYRDQAISRKVSDEKKSEKHVAKKSRAATFGGNDANAS